MTLIIAGSRTLQVDGFQLNDFLVKHKLKPSTIIFGCARGIDACAEVFARNGNYFYKKYYADWDKFGLAAGPIRNRDMAARGDALLLIWDGKSKGSKSMKELALTRGIPVYEEIMGTKNAVT